MRALKRLLTMAVVLATGTMLCASFSAAATLTAKTKDGIGTYLVDDKGIALYLFMKDAPNKSVCGTANGCIEKWPAFFADKVDPKAGLDEAAVGVITREDGNKQTTYKGRPLYYYYKDKDDEDIYGQGMGNVWHLVTP